LNGSQQDGTVEQPLFLVIHNISNVYWHNFYTKISFLKYIEVIKFSAPNTSSFLKNVVSFRGRSPLTPTRGFAPGPHWGLCPQTPYVPPNQIPGSAPEQISPPDT
jgi:hypothetical protein